MDTLNVRNEVELKFTEVNLIQQDINIFYYYYYYYYYY